MAKLVVLSEGMTGQSYELKVDKTTIGRVDDNTFPIPHASVSSHHCEVLLRGSDIVVKDLNSTNGTFIQNEQVTGEKVLKPGQILRLGQVDIRLEVPGAANAKKAPVDSTMVVNRGVNFEDLEKGPGVVDPLKGGFTKKTNKTNKYFIIGGAVLLVVIVIAIWVAYSSLQAHQPTH
jgi:pSer/pThr/pTyr-binding forkhead associated (FHA) protein